MNFFLKSKNLFKLNFKSTILLQKSHFLNHKRLFHFNSNNFSNDFFINIQETPNLNKQFEKIQKLLISISEKTQKNEEYFNKFVNDLASVDIPKIYEFKENVIFIYFEIYCKLAIHLKENHKKLLSKFSLFSLLNFIGKISKNERIEIIDYTNFLFCYSQSNLFLENDLKIINSFAEENLKFFNSHRIYFFIKNYKMISYEIKNSNLLSSREKENNEVILTSILKNIDFVTIVSQFIDNYSNKISNRKMIFFLKNLSELKNIHHILLYKKKFNSSFIFR